MVAGHREWWRWCGEEAFRVSCPGHLLRVVGRADGAYDASTGVIEVGDRREPISGEGVGIGIRWEGREGVAERRCRV